ncbi:hypothetical protein [Enterococcus sp. HY326]|uniref:hypothetical protein n=1 Tax=Enterococcus sp. HY326 TaxID=2971265 RepID=UPI002240B536|nr:hypothetical protein [Enterococcus sp. HY326]
MTTFNFILAVVVFIGTQVIVEKKIAPEKIQQIKLRWLMLLSVVAIGGAVFLATQLHLGAAPVLVVTIIAATILSQKYRLKSATFYN